MSYTLTGQLRGLGTKTFRKRRRYPESSSRYTSGCVQAGCINSFLFLLTRRVTNSFILSISAVQKRTVNAADSQLYFRHRRSGRLSEFIQRGMHATLWVGSCSKSLIFSCMETLVLLNAELFRTMNADVTFSYKTRKLDTMSSETEHYECCITIYVKCRASIILSPICRQETAAVRPETLQMHEASSTVAADFPSAGRRNLFTYA